MAEASVQRTMELVFAHVGEGEDADAEAVAGHGGASQRTGAAIQHRSTRHSDGINAAVGVMAYAGPTPTLTTRRGQAPNHEARHRAQADGQGVAQARADDAASNTDAIEGACGGGVVVEDLRVEASAGKRRKLAIDAQERQVAGAAVALGGAGWLIAQGHARSGASTPT